MHTADKIGASARLCSRRIAHFTGKSLPTCQHVFKLRRRCCEPALSARQRSALHCVAHSGHEHPDRCDHGRAEHAHAEEFAGCSMHSHVGGIADSNPAHRALKLLFDATRLTQLGEWLEDSIPSSIAKIALFAAAALAAWASGGAAGAAQAAALQRLSSAATAGVFFFAGVPAAIRLAYDLTGLRVDTNVLMNLAVVGTLATGHSLEGALLLVLFQSSHVVEHLLTARAQGSLQALYDAVPDHAVVVEVGADGAPAVGTARRVLASEVSVGEVMLVKPGEQVPLDGRIVHGRALVSSEHITGEALPALHRPGDSLPAGALCRDGVLAVRASRLAADSTPQRIARLARDAQAQRPQLRTWLDSFGEIYSRVVMAGSVAALGGMLATGVPLLSTSAQRGALYRAMGLLTVASPCALVMVPLAYVSAIAAVASHGILLKGGRVLDALGGCSIVAVDKTGTLTTGRLSLIAFHPIGPAAQAGTGAENKAAHRAAVAAAAALSLRSSHPVSDSMMLHADSSGVDAGGVPVTDFRLVPGGGVEGTLELPCSSAASGEDSAAASNGSDPSSSSSSSGIARSAAPPQKYHAMFGSFDYVSERLSDDEVQLVGGVASGQGQSSVLSVLVLDPGSGGGGGRSVWAALFQDSVRQQSAEAVAELQQGSWAGAGSRPYEVVMLTGDNAASAARVAAQLGISTVFSSLTPEDKLQRVAALQAGSDNGGDAAKHGSLRAVLMVGDGLNDAAALAAADVGVAIASEATAAASLASDAVVMTSSAGIAAIPLLLRVALATQHVIRQNLVLAAGSILALALPTLLGVVPLWVAVMLHEGSTLLVALNSLRLLLFSAALQRRAAPKGKAGGRAEGAVPAVELSPAAIMMAEALGT